MELGQQQQQQRGKHEQQPDPMALAFDGSSLERPCSSNSADSLSASEAFSMAALDSDTSEGQLELAPAPQSRVPGEHMQAAVRTLLAGVGEDPFRQGLRDTPKVQTLKLFCACTIHMQSGCGFCLCSQECRSVAS